MPNNAPLGRKCCIVTSCSSLSKDLSFAMLCTCGLQKLAAVALVTSFEAISKPIAHHTHTTYLTSDLFTSNVKNVHNTG